MIELVRATGLSYFYNHVKNGRMVPHPRRWGGGEVAGAIRSTPTSDTPTYPFPYTNSDVV